MISPATLPDASRTANGPPSSAISAAWARPARIVRSAHQAIVPVTPTIQSSSPPGSAASGRHKTPQIGGYRNGESHNPGIVWTHRSPGASWYRSCPAFNLSPAAR